jgi:hypothetical protein
MSIGYSALYGRSTTSEYRQLTFIHCSAWRIASKWRATAAWSTRSSASSSIPPRLLVAALDIGAERIGFASWISGEWTTTSRVDSGSTSSCSPSATAGASPPATSIGSAAPPVAPWVSGARPSTGTASGIALPSASAPVNKKTRDYLHSRIILTLYDAGLWQCSLHGQRLGFCLRGGSGLLSGRRGFLFRHRCCGFIPIPGQVC